MPLVIPEDHAVRADDLAVLQTHILSFFTMGGANLVLLGKGWAQVRVTDWQDLGLLQFPNQLLVHARVVAVGLYLGDLAAVQAGGQFLLRLFGQHHLAVVLLAEDHHAPLLPLHAALQTVPAEPVPAWQHLATFLAPGHLAILALHQ